MVATTPPENHKKKKDKKNMLEGILYIKRWTLDSGFINIPHSGSISNIRSSKQSTEEHTSLNMQDGTIF